MHVKSSLHQFTALAAQRVHVKSSLHQVVPIMERFVHVKLSLHQFIALMARVYTLVNTTPVIASVARGLRTGRAQTEHCKLGEYQQQACTKRTAVYIHPLVHR